MTSTPFDIQSMAQSIAAQEPFVRALARRLMSEDVDDVVQQTYARALDQDVSHVRQPRPWLARIVRNVVRNLRRGESRRVTHERRHAAGVSPLVPSSAELVVREERRHALMMAVGQLPGSLRTVIWMRFFEGMPPRAVGKELGVPVEVVWERQRRGLDLLRERLDAEHGGDRRGWLLPLLPQPTAMPLGPASSVITKLTPIVLAMTAKAKIVAVLAVLGLAAIAWQVVPIVGGREEVNTPGGAVPLQGQEHDDPLVAEARGGTKTESDEAAVRRTVVDPDPSMWIVRGLVQSSKTAAVAAAKLIVEVHRGYTSDGEPEMRAEFVSDAEGEFFVPLVPPDHTVTLRFKSRDPKLFVGRKQERVVVRGRDAPQDIIIHAHPLVCRISGTVTDNHDKPIAGARVIANGVAHSTGPQGEFDVDVPAWSFYQFSVFADGYGTKVTSVQLDGPGSHAKTIVQLDAGIRVRGRVVDEHGVPVVGAEVGTILSSGYRHAESDADGHFEINWLRGGSTRHALFVRKKGYAPIRVTISLNDAKASHDIVLLRGVRIEGRVVDAANNPVAGAEVNFGERRPAKARTLSDDDGRFEFEAAPAGKHQFIVKAAAFAADARILDVPSDRETVTLDITLAAGHSIAGSVVDQHGQPIAGANIGVYLTPYSFGLAQTTDEDGRFRITGVGAGEWALSTFKPGFLRRGSKERADDENVRIRLDQAAFAAGRVIDARTGEPIRHFRIFEMPPRLEKGERAGVSLGFGDAGKDVKNEKGEWISKYPSAPGSILGVYVLAKGYAPGVDSHLIAKPVRDPSASVIELLPGSTIRGTVHDAAGEPVARAVVYAATKDRPFDVNPVFTRSKNVAAETNEQGSFTLRDAPTGAVTLFVRHPKWPLTKDGPFMAVAETPTLREIRMLKSATVHGTLRGVDGKPVAGIKVQLFVKNGVGVSLRLQRWTETTDREGRFRFETRIAAGTYALAIPTFEEKRLSDVFIHKEIEVERGGTHHVDLGPAGRCELRVQIPAATDDESSYVHIVRVTPEGKRAPGATASWMRVTHGDSVLRGLKPGRYRVRANMSRGKANAFATVTAGKRGEVSLALRK